MLFRSGPAGAPGDTGVEHLFVVRHAGRDRLCRALRGRGVGTAIHYPVPCHLQEAYRSFGDGPGSLPVTEQAADEIFSLPMYAELTDEQVEAVIAATLDSVQASTP